MNDFSRTELVYSNASGIATVFFATDDRLRNSVIDVPEISIPASLKNAVPKRQNEYRIGRLAAIEALKLAGCSNPIVSEHQPNQTPNWPNGFIGSITHTAGLIGAAVGSSKVYRGIGIDAETIMSEKTATRVAHQILTVTELGQLTKTAQLLSLTEEKALTVFFCAKEAIYKAHSRIFPERKHFHDVRVELSKNGFSYMWTDETARYKGELIITDKHAVTLVALT